MRTLCFLISLMSCLNSFGQEQQKGILINDSKSDSCRLIDSLAELNLVTLKRHASPLVIANDIIVSMDSTILDVNKISSIDILKCPAYFNKYGFIGYNRVIEVKTKQHFETTCPYKIRMTRFKRIKGKFVYAINGDLISDSLIKLASNVIQEIEIISTWKEKKKNNKLKNINCINIWTLKKDDRGPISPGCGLRFKTN
jgi:hypothetical protein